MNFVINFRPRCRINSLLVMVLVFGFFILGQTTEVSAYTYGDPAKENTHSGLYFGIIASQFDRKVESKIQFETTGPYSAIATGDSFKSSNTEALLGLTMGTETNLELSYGILNIEDSGGGEADGTVAGVYFKIGGAFVYYASGKIENDYWDGDFIQWDLGYGFSGNWTQSLSAYLSFVFSKFEMELIATDTTLVNLSSASPVTFLYGDQFIKEKSPYGIITGLQYNVTESVIAALEIHGLNETGLGFRLSGGF